MVGDSFAGRHARRVSCHARPARASSWHRLFFCPHLARNVREVSLIRFVQDFFQEIPGIPFSKRMWCSCHPFRASCDKYVLCAYNVFFVVDRLVIGGPHPGKSKPGCSTLTAARPRWRAAAVPGLAAAPPFTPYKADTLSSFPSETSWPLRARNGKCMAFFRLEGHFLQFSQKRPRETEIQADSSVSRRTFRRFLRNWPRETDGDNLFSVSRGQL